MSGLRTPLSLGLVALALLACRTDRGDTPIPPATAVTSGAQVAPDAPQPAARAAPPSGDLTLAPVVEGLLRPVLVTAPRGDARLFIVEQDGRVRVLHDGQMLTEPFVDVSQRVSTRNPEQGLLGLAFHPRFPEDPRVFLHMSERKTGDGMVLEFKVDPAAPHRVDRSTERILLRVAQPYGNHDGGHLEFGPHDGFLYIGLGDGGAGGDPHGHGQDKGTMLGSMLRIDVDSTPAGRPYGIPPDNPFVADPDARPEAFAYGLRNPWRYHFDPSNGDLVIADVGQNAVEEIDLLAAGAGGVNFGWAIHEGTACFKGHADCGAPGLVAPIVEYSARPPCNSVTGGPVYRGGCIDGLAGTWFYSDFCHNFVRTFRLDGGQAVDREDRTGDLDPRGDRLMGVSSFGVDGFGELYIVSHHGVVYRLVAG